MKRQKSFENEAGPALYLLPTPIGNRQEISPRVLSMLEAADVIACEDTRNSGQLLKSLNVSRPLIAHHEHNSAASTSGIVQLLEQGKKVAVISDAGYPLISDPGSQLVRAAIDAEVPVISASGSNAALIALVASGLSADHYLFYGFLDHKSARRRRQLQALEDFPFTMIFYEAPHRIEATLKDMREQLGSRQACLARELTKVHEEYLRGTIDELIEAAPGLKGEMVLVVEGAPRKTAGSLDEAACLALELSKQGLKPKQAARQAAGELGCSNNEVYARMLALREEQNRDE